MCKIYGTKDPRIREAILLRNYLHERFVNKEDLKQQLGAFRKKMWFS